MTGPLSGVRVMEFASIGPGPHCAMLLSDLGAEVLAVQVDDCLPDDTAFSVKLTRCPLVISTEMAGPLAVGVKVC